MTQDRRRALVFAALPIITLGIVIGCGSFGTGNSGSSSSGSSSSSGALADGASGEGAADGSSADAFQPTADGAACGAMASSTCTGGSIQTIRFDNTSLPNDWDAGGSVAIQDEAFCAARALRTEGTVPSFTPALATHRFGGGKISKGHLRYAMRGPAHRQDAELKFGCSLYFMADNPAEQTSEFRFELEADGRLQIDGSTKGSSISHDGDGFVIESTTSANAWRTVDVGFIVTATKITAVGTFDGLEFSIFLNTKVHPSVNEIRCGIEEAQGADGSYVVYIDDVQIESCPLL